MGVRIPRHVPSASGRRMSDQLGLAGKPTICNFADAAQIRSWPQELPPGEEWVTALFRSWRDTNPRMVGSKCPKTAASTHHSRWLRILLNCAIQEWASVVSASHGMEDGSGSNGSMSTLRRGVRSARRHLQAWHLRQCAAQRAPSEWLATSTRERDERLVHLGRRRAFYRP